MKIFKSHVWFIITITILCTFSISCSGGSSSNGKRSNQTAVRVFHAGLDAVPVGLFLGENLIGETSYLSNSVFTPVSPQEALLRLTRSNRFDEPVIEFPVQLQTATEYSIFIYGEVKRGTFQVRLLEEPLVVPAEGNTRIQYLHALIDVPSVRFRLSGQDDVVVRYGGNSGFFEIPSGDKSLTILDASGRTLSSLTLNARDQGELSVVLAGKADYSFVSVKVYEDFD
jgi:hypothetical protein